MAIQILPAALAALTGFRAVRNISQLAKWYNKNKFAQSLSSGPFGIMYASGTVLGYHSTSQFFKPKWKYLGSPQRVSKL